MQSSGTSSLGTSGSGTVTLLTGGSTINRIVIVNEGTNAGLFSIDAGATWGRIPAATASYPGTVEVWERTNVGCLMKRVGGADLSGIWAFGTWVEEN